MMYSPDEIERIAELVAAKAPSTFLSSAEIAELTGRRAHKLQIETLRKQGVPFFLNAAGRPVVPRSAIDGRGVAAPKPAKKAWTPPD